MLGLLVTRDKDFKENKDVCCCVLYISCTDVLMTDKDFKENK